MRRHLNSRGVWALVATAGIIAGCDVSGPALFGAHASAADPAVQKAQLENEQGICDTDQNAADVADQLLRLINIERFDIGGVEFDPALTDIATHYACTMIEEGFFGHIHPRTGAGLVERVDAAHYRYFTIGENLAAGIARANGIMDAWMVSDAHREVLTDPAFTRAGIAVRHGGEYGVYCVLLLAEPAE